MARPKGGKKNAARGGGTLAKAGDGATAGERFGAALRLASAGLIVLIFAGVGAGGVLGMRRLEARAAESIDAEPIRVVFNWPPIGTSSPEKPGTPPVTPLPPLPAAAPGATWLHEEFQQELVNVVRNTLGTSPNPFRGDVLASVGANLLRTGWFDQIGAVRREPGGVVRIDATWRLPAAVVRSGKLDRVVARGGELLTPAYRPGECNLPVITGAKRPSPADAKGRPTYGEPWAGGDVQAGLSLLALMRGQPYWDQVAEIDVSKYLSDKQLTIVTERGGRIVWGGAPTDALVNQQRAEVKLRHLDILYSKFGLMDGGKDKVEVYSQLVVVDHTASGERP